MDDKRALDRIEKKIDRMEVKVDSHHDQLIRLRSDRWWALGITSVVVTFVAAWIGRH